MAVRGKHSDEDSLFFVTFTCLDWLHLIDLTNSYDSVYARFNHLQHSAKAKVRALMPGYVIMPNHLHFFLYFPDRGFDVTSVVGNMKRFIGYDIVARLEKQHEWAILDRLSAAVPAYKRQKGQRHQVFKDDSDAKPIRSLRFFLQKLDYSHLNPVRGIWHLVDDWRDYPHSSAGFYEYGKPSALFCPVHYNDFLLGARINNK